MLKREEAFAVLVEALSGEESFMGCEAENITQNASLRDDLGLDSLDQVEMAITLEDMLGIEEIGYDEIDDAATVADVVSMLCGKRVIKPEAIARTLARIEVNRQAEAELQKKVKAEIKRAQSAKAAAASAGQ